MANTSPPIKGDISVKTSVIENILLGDFYTPEKIVSYKVLFQEFHDIFAWSYVKIPGLNLAIVEHHIDTWSEVTRAPKA